MVTTSASVPRAGEAGAAGGRSAVRAAGMEEFVWLLSSATARRDSRDIIVKKVNLALLLCLPLLVLFLVVCRPNCINGGKCRKNGRCRCPKRFTGPRCEVAKKSVRGGKKSKRKGRKRRNRRNRNNRVNADLVKQFLSLPIKSRL